MIGLQLAVVVAIFGCRDTTLARPRVDLDTGTIEGVVTASGIAFLGVPYANPPVGAARWQPPGTAPHWDGVRSAVALGPRCPQPDTSERERRFAAAVGEDPPPRWATSEDCLTVNVWTPKLDASPPRPVIVWIHGGSFTTGAGGDQPASLAALGAVVVTFNYRLGLLGFLAHPALTAESPHHASGNYGILDQIAALRWVQHNIVAFGGDRHRVTVVGHSSGGGAVLQLIASPLARGLFRGGIVQSGSLDGSRALDAAEADGVAIAMRLGAPTAAPLPTLRALPVEALVAASPRGAEATTDGWVLPMSGPDALRAGRLDGVRLIVGTTAHEADIFAFPALDRDAYIADVRASDGVLADAVLARYPPADDVVAAARRRMTDREFACPARFIAAHRGGPTWLYRFTLAPGPDLGAFHGSELHLLFGHPHNPAEARASDALRRYWVGFAATGDPNQPGLPAWPTYRQSPPHWLQIGARVVAVESPAQPGCDVFDKTFLTGENL